MSGPSLDMVLPTSPTTVDSGVESSGRSRKEERKRRKKETKGDRIVKLSYDPRRGIYLGFEPT